MPPQGPDNRSSTGDSTATLQETSRSATTPGGSVTEEEVLGYRRSSVDLLRLLTYLVISAAAIVATVLVEDSVVRLEADLVRLVDRLSSTIVRIVHGVIEWIALVTIGAFVLIPLVTRRSRLFGYVAVSGLLAAGLMSGVLALLDRRAERQLLMEVLDRDDLSAAVTFGPIGVSISVAAFVTLSPFLTAQWRRAGRIGITALVIARLVAASGLPGDVLISLPVGATAGTAVLWAFGRPRRRPRSDAIRAVLQAQAVPVRALTMLDDGDGGTTRGQAVLEDGRVLDVRVEGDERRAVDLMTRIYRWALYRDGGLDRPFSSLRRSVEHQALMSLVCADVGVQTPRVRTLAPVGLDSMLIAHERVETLRFDDFEQSEESVVVGLLQQVSVLHDHRIAHRNLGPDTIGVDAEGVVWLVGFEHAELAADDALLATDTAAALVTASALIGSSSATKLAIETLSVDTVARALPRLQPAALGRSTRAALQQHPGLLDELRDEVQLQTGIEEFEPDQLDRIDRQTLFMAVVLVAAVYFLLPQFADLPRMVDRLKSASWWWAGPILVATAVTFIGSSLSLGGAVVSRLRPGPVFVSQVATAFAKTLGPAGVGGMALNVRFLRRQGVDRPVAVAAVGLRTVVGVVVHFSLLLVFVIWARRSAFTGLRLPKPEWLLVGLLAVVVCAAIALLVPKTRQLLATRLWPTLRRAFDGLGAVLRRPDRLALLVGGWAMVTGSNLLSLYFAVEALGGGLSLATVGAVYLVGAIVATVAPTPGGIGAIEAALISGLVAAGLSNSAAVPAVILFRLLTFWAPIVPGWFGLRWLQAHDDL